MISPYPKIINRLIHLIILLICIINENSHCRPFSIDDILSVPYPISLTAAFQSDQIAWILNDQGVRNIWTAQAPDFNPVQLTHYTEDDGQPISQLALTPDGAKLVYVRGGSLNLAGEHPNPTSDPLGTEQAIWAISTKGGKSWKLAQGSNPVISPTGKEILFTYEDQICVAFIDTSMEDSIRNSQQLFQARGSNNNPKWSPDGLKVLFVSDRKDHSFIGVYSRMEHKILWIAPSVDRDSDPVWSPDGRKIAFIRVPGARKNELFNYMGGWSFAIWIADATTGEGHELWRSPADDGGFAQYYPSKPLRWTKNNQLLFYSEHEGWMHIYSIPASGGSPLDITPEQGETEHSSVSRDGKYLYYSSNYLDIDRRNIWRVPTSGGNPIQLTKGNGIETDPVSLSSGKYIVFRSASARRPQAITLISEADGGNFRIISPKNMPSQFPIKQLVEPKSVIIKASDGLQIHCQLFISSDEKSGKRKPAVIFMHGGPIRQMLLGWHYMEYYAKSYAFNQFLANTGYVVLSVNFRAGIGYGRNFRRAENQGPRGASEYRDIIAAGLYLRNLSEVNAERIGLWGGSYGGYLTALGLARDSDLFAAGVDLHGVHDWAFRATDFSPGGEWAIIGEELLEMAYKSSPVSDLSYWSSPILLVHGDDDRNVLFAQTTDLAQRLRNRGVPVETLVFPDEVHSFLKHKSWLQTFQAAADFFNRFLK